MTFALVAIAGMYVGRKLGWWLSHSVLYTARTWVAAFVCVFWAVAVAGGIYGLIGWQDPGLVIRLVLGYALGAYVAIPNYGLVGESTVPTEARPRHEMVSGLPLGAYAAGLIAVRLSG